MAGKKQEKEFIRTAFPKKVIRGYTAGRINVPNFSVLVTDGPTMVRVEVLDIETDRRICAMIVEREA
jgi:hypothetical protein